MLDMPALEGWLWDAACQIRGPLDAPKFKDYILPLISLKRLSDVFEDEVARLGEEFGDPDVAAQIVEEDHGLVRFYVPAIARWQEAARRTTGLGEHLTDAARAVARENPAMQGVIDMVDFNATAAGQRIVDDGRLASLVTVLSRHRLGLNDVEPDVLGRAYEYLLRKFAEGQGQSAGEFYTPPEVGQVMARMLDPQPGNSVYDPACGSGGLLIKCHLRLLQTHGEGQNGRHALPPSMAGLRLYPVDQRLHPVQQRPPQKLHGAAAHRAHRRAIPRVARGGRRLGGGHAGGGHPQRLQPVAQPLRLQRQGGRRASAGGGGGAAARSRGGARRGR